MSAVKKKKAPSKPLALVVGRDEYDVDGGRLMDGGAEIVCGGAKIGAGIRRTVTLFVPRGELGFYPIGAKVRVTIERLS